MIRVFFPPPPQDLLRRSFFSFPLFIGYGRGPPPFLCIGLALFFVTEQVVWCRAFVIAGPLSHFFPSFTSTSRNRSLSFPFSQKHLVLSPYSRAVFSPSPFLFRYDWYFFSFVHASAADILPRSDLSSLGVPPFSFPPVLCIRGRVMCSLFSRLLRPPSLFFFPSTSLLVATCSPW